MDTNIARIERLFEAYDNMVERALHLAIYHYENWDANRYDKASKLIASFRSKCDATAIILEMMRKNI